MSKLRLGLLSKWNWIYDRRFFYDYLSYISNNHKKVGIEHASKETIFEALSRVYDNNTNQETITNKDLFLLGLNGNPESAILRDKISEYLNIGKPNAKTFLKRLNMLGLTKEEVEQIIWQVK